MERLGRYMLVDRIAAGGMAEVHRAVPADGSTYVRALAIKMILPDAASDERMITMMMDEARICAALHHPNIVRVLDVGEDRGRHFLVMEYVSGRHLGNVIGLAIQRRVEIPIPLALYVARESLLGLQHAHTRTGTDGEPLAIVHRDVSPQNILVAFDGTVKVADFGIARARHRRTRTEAGVIKGKLGYMSPEQALGEALDARSDVYAMGVVLWEMLARQRMHAASSNDMALLLRIARGERRTLKQAGVAVPPELEALVERALERDPRRRVPTAGVFAQEAGALLERLAPGYGRAQAEAWLKTLFDRALVDEEQRRLAELLALARALATPTINIPAITPDARRGSLIAVPRVEGAAIRPAMGVPAAGLAPVPALPEPSPESDVARAAREVVIPDGPQELPPRAARKVPWKPLALGAGMVAMAGGVAVLVTTRPPQQPAPAVPAPAVSSVRAPAAEEPRSLRIESSPPGATITVNGRVAGKAPVRVSHLPGEELEVTATLPGFARERLVVRPDHDGPVATLELRTRLEDVLPSVRVAPPGATSVARVSVSADRRGIVFVDGISTEKEPPILLELAPGEHDVLVMDVDHGETTRQRINVAADTFRELRLRFAQPK